MGLGAADQPQAVQPHRMALADSATGSKTAPAYFAGQVAANRHKHYHGRPQ
jgi:hypothetical protein